MAKSTSKAAKIKALAKFKKNIDSAKTVEAKVTGRTLPGGLRRAIAQISATTKFDLDKNGNPYFLVAGTVLEPEEYKGTYVGLFYNFQADPEWFNEPQTEQEKFDKFFSHMKTFGYDQDLIADMVAFAEVLVKDAPHFLFNTSNNPSKDGEFKAYFQMGVPVEEETEEDDAPSYEGSEFSPGDYVIVDGIEGDTDCPWNGVIKEVNGESAQVEFEDDGEEYTIELEYLSLAEAE
jgi:hypothetical protein